MVKRGKKKNPGRGVQVPELFCALIFGLWCSGFGLQEVNEIFEMGGYPVSMSSIKRIVANQATEKASKKKPGRKPFFDKFRLSRLGALMNKLTDARQDHELTVPYIHRVSRFKCSVHVIKRAIADLGWHTVRPRHRKDPLPTDDGDRLSFCKKYVSVKDWGDCLFIDETPRFRYGKTVALRKSHKRGAIRFVWHKTGKPQYKRPATPPKADQDNYQQLRIIGGVIASRAKPVCLWGQYQRLTAGAFLNFMKETRKSTSFRRVVLDHHKSHCAKEVKRWFAKEGIEAIYIPKRTPGLDVMDYSVWSEILRSFNKSPVRKESEKSFCKRLEKCARGLPSSFVRKAVGDFSRRMKTCISRGGSDMLDA